MSAALVLLDKALDIGLPLPVDSDLPTLLHCRAVAAGGEARAIAMLALDEIVAPPLRKRIRRSDRKIPLALVQEALRWHVLRTVEIIAGWGDEGDLASPLWEVDTLLRFERFVAILWYPYAPRIAMRWASRHQDTEYMPSAARFQTVALWRGRGPPPGIKGWSAHPPARSMQRPRIARSEGP